MNESIVVKKCVVVKEYDFNKPGIYEVDYLLGIIIDDRRKKIFHSFVYRCVCDIKYTNITNNEDVILTISLGYMEFKSD